MPNIDDTNLIFSGNPVYINVFNDEQSSLMDGIVLGGPQGSISCSAPIAGCSRDRGSDTLLPSCPPVAGCFGDGNCPLDGTSCVSDCSDNCSEFCAADKCKKDCSSDIILPGECYIPITGGTTDLEPCFQDGGGCLDGGGATIIYYAVGIKFHISGYTETTTTDVHRTTGAAGITFNNWVSEQPCYLFTDGGTYPLTRDSNGVYYVTKLGTSTTPANFTTTTTAGTTGYKCKVTINMPGYNDLTVTANTFFYANTFSNYQTVASITAKTVTTTAQVKMHNMQLSVSSAPDIPSPIKFEISKSDGTKYYAYSLQYGTVANAAYITIYSSSYTGSIFVRSVGVGGTTSGYNFPSTRQKITFSNGTRVPISSTYFPGRNQNSPIIATLKLATQIYPNLGQSSNGLCMSKYSYGSASAFVLSGSVTSDYQQWRLTDILRPASLTAANQLWGTSYNTKIII